MKSIASRIGTFVVVIAITGVCGYFLGYEEEIDSVQHVYLQTPDEFPKPEHSLRVTHISRAKDDDARLRGGKDTWRIYLAEIDTVIYLEQRKGE